MTGGSWTEHLRGGLCIESSWDFNGGFGGGGASCGPGGGGGGGHIGETVWVKANDRLTLKSSLTGGLGGNYSSGFGGWSFSALPGNPIVREAPFGHGYVLIYPCLLQCPTGSSCRFKGDHQVCICSGGQMVNEKRGEKCPHG